MAAATCALGAQIRRIDLAVTKTCLERLLNDHREALEDFEWQQVGAGEVAPILATLNDAHVYVSRMLSDARA